MKKKPHRIKSIDYAVMRMRDLERQIKKYDQLCGQMQSQMELLAKLAADGPAFDDPMAAMVAKNLRDQILRRCGLNPDGTRL